MSDVFANVVSSSVTLWGQISNIFGGSNLHWDRSNISTVSGNDNPVYVDTFTAASGYNVANSLTYTIEVSAGDQAGDRQPGVVVDTTTMVFPFLAGNGASSSASAGVVFSTTNGIESGGVVYFVASATPGQYDVRFRSFADNLYQVSTSASAITLGASPITLSGLSGLSSLVNWSIVSTANGFLIAYSTGTSSSQNIYLAAYSTSGVLLSGVKQVATNSPASWAIRTDSGGGYYYVHEDNTNPAQAAAVVQTFNPLTGVLGSALTIASTMSDLTSLDLRNATSGNGNFFLAEQGVNSTVNLITAGVYNSSGTELGTLFSTGALNSTTGNHFEAIAVPGASIGDEYALVYNDATTPGGATFNVHIELFNGTTGAKIGADTVLSSPVALQNFDRVRGIGNGLIEITYRSNTTGNVNAIIYDTNTVGQTQVGTAGNDLLVGTAFGDTINAGQGNDLISAGPGVNTIDGGGGFDRITFTVASTSATMVQNGNGSWTITISSTGETDTVTNTEIAVFTDKTIALRELARTDLNGNGTSDMLLQSGGTVIDWIVQNGAAVAGNVVGGAGAYVVSGTGDFNGDGVADVLLQNGGAVVDWIVQNGVAVAGNLVGNAGAYTVVGEGDFNGDGTTDVLLQNGGNVVDWIMQNGVAVAGNLVGNAGAYSVVGEGDFNGDGTTDVLLQNGGNIVVWNIKNGVAVSGAFVGNAGAYSVVGEGDFTGDGTTDILLQNGGSIVDWVIHNDVATAGNVLGSGLTGWSIVGTGDYNGDGVADIALQSGSTVVNWTMAPGSGTVATGVLLGNSGGYIVKS
jgi:hypothetical protein